MKVRLSNQMLLKLIKGVKCDESVANRYVDIGLTTSGVELEQMVDILVSDVTRGHVVTVCPNNSIERILGVDNGVVDEIACLEGIAFTRNEEEFSCYTCWKSDYVKTKLGVLLLRMSGCEGNKGNKEVNFVKKGSGK